MRERESALVSMKEIETLWEEVRELSLGSSTRVERLDSPPTPLRFLREFVSANRPCIISNATLHWPALTSWSHDDYLSRALSHDDVVSVHLTPNGRADALVPHPDDASSLCFASAHVQRMPFPLALRLISADHPPTAAFVAYAQQQNDCFRSEYSALAADCEPHIPWATEALGCLPEAVNLWIGNHHSETSFHKDHYENLYAVVSGEKHFLLLPPTDVHRLYIRSCPAARYSYSQDTGEFALELENPVSFVPWCSVNPYPSPETKDTEMSQFPLYFNGPKPFECTVKAGEILYFVTGSTNPSFVASSLVPLLVSVELLPFDVICCIWMFHSSIRWLGYTTFDFSSPDDFLGQFDIKYAYFNFLQSTHYLSSRDPTMLGMKCEDSQSDASMCNLREESHIDGSVANAAEGSKDSEEE